MKKATELADGKAAILCRLACLEGKARGMFYKFCPPSRIWVFSNRVQFKRPGWVDTGAGGMTAYCWIVWEHGYAGKPQLGWI